MIVDSKAVQRMCIASKNIEQLANHLKFSIVIHRIKGLLPYIGIY